MSYEKLNLINGEKFSAEHVSHIEDGIVQNALDVETQVNQIKGDIVILRDEVVFSSYKENNFVKTENYYINGTGSIMQAPSQAQGYFYVTIPVENGDVVNINVPTFYTSSIGILSLWSDENTLIKVIRKGVSTQFTESFTIKEDCLLRFSANSNYPIEFTLIKKHNSQIEKIKESVGLFQKRTNEYYKDVIVSSKYVNINGVINTVSSSLGYYYIPFTVNKGDVVKVETSGLSTGVAVLSEFNSDGEFIKIISRGDSGKKSDSFVVDADNTILYFSARSTQTNTIEVYIADNSQYSIVKESMMDAVDEKYSSLLDFKFEYAVNKVLCIGDSLTAGAYYGDWYTETHNVGDDINENYPNVLGRMLNCEVTNGGVNGDYPTRWVVNELPKYNLYDYDTFVIWFGTNNGLTDTLDTDVNPYADYNQYANTETGKYCYLIEKIKADNPSAFIMLNTVFYSSGDKDTTNAVIQKIANKYGLKVNDLSMYNHNSYPEYHANQGNIHLGKAGNIVVANTIVNNLHEWFNENPLLCEFHVTNKIQR